MHSIETIKKLNDNDLHEYHEFIKNNFIKNNPLTILNKINDVRQSPDYSGVDIKTVCKATKMQVVNTYFVDSTGYGQEHEAAMTVKNFFNVIGDLIKEHGKGKLRSCITDVGQFQVYVTIVKPQSKG